MNGDPHGVPIIGQQQRIIITDHRIIAPNSIEVIPNGLSMGDSIASLRVIDPLKGRAYHVPLTEAQVQATIHQLADAVGWTIDISAE